MRSFNALTHRTLRSAFANDQTLITSSLLGKLAMHIITYNDSGKLQVNTTWTGEVTNVTKVNAIAVSQQFLLVGGIAKNQKGAVEVWTTTQSS